MVTCTGTGEYAVHVLASPSVYHSFGRCKTLLIAGLLSNSSFNFSKVKSRRICCSEASIRCTDSKIRPLGSNVVDSKFVCTCFVPQVTVSGAFTVIWLTGRSVDTLPQYLSCARFFRGSRRWNCCRINLLRFTIWIMIMRFLRRMHHQLASRANTLHTARSVRWGYGLPTNESCVHRCGRWLRRMVFKGRWQFILPSHWCPRHSFTLQGLTRYRLSSTWVTRLLVLTSPLKVLYSEP